MDSTLLFTFSLTIVSKWVTVMAVPFQGVSLLGDDSVFGNLDFAYNAFCIVFLEMLLFILKTKLEYIRKRENQAMFCEIKKIRAMNIF